MTARPRDVAPVPELITVRWPGGPHDFVFETAKADTAMAGRIPPEGGWLWLTGMMPGYGTRTFYVQQLGEREYALKPKLPWTPIGLAAP